MRRVAFLLALLVTLAACSGADNGSQPTPTTAGNQGTPAAKPGLKVVTELERPPTPTPAPPSPTPVLPTPTPLPVARLALLSSRTYKDAAGSVWVVGEAQNTGDTAAANVEVTMSLVGPDGKPLATSYATTYLAEIPAGGKTPFRGMFAQPPTGWTDVKIDLTAAPEDPLEKSQFVRGLKVERSTITASANGAIVAGEVRNAGQQPALTVRVMAVVRGPDGKVQDVVDGYAKLPELAPNAISPFSLQFPDAKQAGPYEVFLQGRTKPSLD